MGAQKGGSGQVHALRDAVVVLKWGPRVSRGSSWSRGLYWGRWLCWVLIWTVNGYALVVIQQDDPGLRPGLAQRDVRLVTVVADRGGNHRVTCRPRATSDNPTRAVVRSPAAGGGRVDTKVTSHPRWSCRWVAPPHTCHHRADIHQKEPARALPAPPGRLRGRPAPPCSDNI